MKHAHRFNFDCFEVNGHKHRLMGYTEYSLSFGVIHFHYFRGVCSYNGHTHSFYGFTGVPKKTENGHLHKMTGFLQDCKFHEHCYHNYTQENVEYNGKNSTLRVAIGSK